MSDQKPTLPDVAPFPSSGPRAFSHGRRQGPLQDSREALTQQTVEQALQDVLEGLRLNNITGGVLELGTLRDIDQKFIVDLDSALLTVKDNQDPEVDRVRLGKLGAGSEDYGLEIFDASGSQIISATGLGVNVVGTDQLQDEAVTEPKVGSNAISSSKIVDAAVITSKIDDEAVEASKIGNLAVTEAKVAASAISTAKIADEAVETAKLADAAATEAKVATNAISETKIQDDAISTPKLQASSVVAGKIAAGAVETAKLDALAVTAEKIAAGAITTGKLDALAVTSEKIAADAVTANKVAARAIAAQNLFVGSFDNLIRNPGFEQSSSLDEWDAAGGGGSFSLTTSNVRSGDRAASYDPSGQSSFAALANTSDRASPPAGDPDYVAVSEGDQLYAEAYVRKVGTGAANRARIVISYRDSDGGGIGSQTSGSLVTPIQAYQKITVTSTAPSDAAFAVFELQVSPDGDSEVIVFDDVYARRMVTGAIVVDGTITADHIAANTITADKIAANTITADEIAANTITTDELAADTLDAENINAGTLTAGVIIASSAFTAASPIFEGVVDVEGGDGNTRLRLHNADGGHIIFYDTSTIQQAVMGYITADSLFKLQSDDDIEIDTDGDIHLNMGVSGVLELSTALALSAGSATSNWLELLINGTTYKVRLYADS